MDTDELETPDWLFDQLRSIFNFSFDAAASAMNHKCTIWSGDSLDKNWKEITLGGVVWLNPPYSNPGPFLSKAVGESHRGVTTVALIKGDPSTRWWRVFVEGVATIVWIPNRIRFHLNGEPTKYPASFPSVLAIYWGVKWKP